MKMLIIGASGVLGSSLYDDAIKKKWNVMGTYCSHEYEGLFYLDLKDKSSINKIFHFFSPEIVVLAGGLTDVDLCEEKPRLAENVNIKGTLNIIGRIKKYGARLVIVSTDYVFNGEEGPYTEEDRPSPINTYGRTKLEAEEAVKGHLDDYLIVRTAQLYGVDRRAKNFAVKIIHNMKSGKKVYAADDFYSTPTYAGSLSGIIIRLIEMGKTGVFHMAGTEFLNRYDYVCTISDVFDLDKSLIQKVKLEDLHLKARRPKKTGLKIDKVSRELKSGFFNCTDGLRLFKTRYLS